MFSCDGSWVRAVTLLLLAGAACADQSPLDPVPPAESDLVVLNSTGQTLAFFRAGEELTPVGQPVDMGPEFDGDAFDLSSAFAASTVSSFGGSAVVFVDLDTREVLKADFPEPDAQLANPSRPSFDDDGVLWVGGRGSDAVYRVTPGEAVATQVARDVGTFVERVVPVGGELFVVDANLDDDGLTFQPHGPSRVVVLSRAGEVIRTETLPAEALNATDAVARAGLLIILAGGTFDPVTFAPRADGALVTMPLAGGTPSVHPLEANGISLEAGRDGNVYVTTTSDFAAIDVLRFDPERGAFDRGPENPIRVRVAGQDAVSCWSATALSDGRLTCVTFSFAEAGRLLLARPDGSAIAEVPSGFGSTDLAVR